MPFEPFVETGNLAEGIAELDAIDDTEIAGVYAKQQLYEELVESKGYKYSQFLADAWCAAFLWKKTADPKHPYPITEELFRKIGQSAQQILSSPHGIEIRRLAEQYQFFHWHLAFPDVFRLPSNKERLENELAGWNGGFDVVLGNPPWERIKLQEKEWFAQQRPEIANALNANARKQTINELAKTDEALYVAFKDDVRKAAGKSHFARKSGRYPLCGRGDINTYAIFAETNRMLMSERGRVGCIVPSGIATDDTTKYFFSDLIKSDSLASLYDFENRERLFPEVHRSYKFCLLTLAGRKLATGRPDFVFFAHAVEDLKEEQRHFTLSATDLALLNPNTLTCPIFRNRRDAELTKAIYARVPVLIKEEPSEVNPWNIRFAVLFHMANDSSLFRTRIELENDGWQLSGNIFSKDGKEMLPLYEAKMLHQFDHRWASYEDLETADVTPKQKSDPKFVVQPRYWVPREEVIYKITRVPADVVKAFRTGNDEDLRTAVRKWLENYELAKAGGEVCKRVLTTKHQQLIEQCKAAQRFMVEHPLNQSEADALYSSDYLRYEVEALIKAKVPRWLLGWRDVSRSTDERTVIASALPLVGVGNTSSLMFTTQDTTHIACLQANLTAFVFDFVVRQKIGGTHLSYGCMKQLPTLPPSIYSQPCKWQSSLTLREWIVPRVLELSYTAYDMKGFAEDCGYAGEPFAWNEHRRFLLRAELDAAYFHLYGIEREDVAYILDSFPIVQRRDQDVYNEYRTKRVILEAYDAIQKAINIGQPYQTLVDPPPANGWTPPALQQEEVSTAVSLKKSEEKAVLFTQQSESLQERFNFGDSD